MHCIEKIGVLDSDLNAEFFAKLIEFFYDIGFLDNNILKIDHHDHCKKIIEDSL